MLGNLLAHFVSPVNKLCCQDVDGPCLRAGQSMSEILDEARGVGPATAEVLVDGKNLRGVLPRGPKERLVPTYTTTTKKIELEGDPLYAGNILQLKLGESIYEMHFSLHANGFSITPLTAETGAEAIFRPWSPFSLVEKCQVKAMQQSSCWSVFKLTVFKTEGSDDFLYFATSGSKAHEERDAWLRHISNCINQVTGSLFPSHAITVQPVPWVPMTITRIMAGYLLQSCSQDNVSLIYCELHAYSGGEARMTIYKDEWCDLEVRSLLLADTSVVSTRKGCYCTVFGVDDYRFCARTKEEKELWLRAVSNIKVKLMFDAPDPTDEELNMFRSAIRERIDTINPAPFGKPVEAAERSLPLLQQVSRLPDIMSPRGDVWNPDPIDDAAECSPQPQAFEDKQAIEAIESAELALKDSASWLGSVGAVDMLKPEECRQLVKSVTPLVQKESSRPCVPQEDAGVNKTVHLTGKLVGKSTWQPVGLPSGQVVRASGGRNQMCTDPCAATSIRDTGAQETPRECTTTAPNVPLLSWSPGPRKVQAGQYAV